MKNRVTRLSPLAFALAPLLAAAQTAPHVDPHEHARPPVSVGKVTVKASPTKKSLEELTQPVAVLTGESLDQVKAVSLGETVSKLTGVQSTSFGPAVGRPIIRGMDGARVAVTSNGMGTGDVSTLSNDHAVTVEPFLADQIEVLKGPATLMYGSGAIGGAVNVIDGRVPDTITTDHITGRTELRYGTANSAKTGMFRLDGAGMGGKLIIHADAVHRESGDLKIPGYADIHGAEEDDAIFGQIPNTFVRTDSAALGASWFGSHGFLGGGVSMFSTRYGIPAGAHVHEHDHDHDGHNDHAHEEHSDNVRIVMNQRRGEIKGALENVGPFVAIRPHVVRNNYTHTEFEGDAVGTVFENVSTTMRTDFILRKFGGWDNAFGVQAGRETQSAIGDEAFIPSTRSRDSSAYWYGGKRISPVQLDAGARVGRVSISPDSHDDRRFTTKSGAVSAKWFVTPSFNINGGLDHAERAPSVEELFANGPHIATQTYEMGDETLSVEKANRGELGLGWKSRGLSANVSVYQARFDNFSYLKDMGFEEDHLPVRQWVQAPARFTGVDAEVKWNFANNDSGVWDARVFGDTVRAKLTNGVNLPRIAPSRVGAELSWRRDDWRASLSSIQVSKAKNLAPGETPTKGYNRVDAHVAWHHDFTPTHGFEIFLDGTNLLNKDIRLNTSFLKDSAPQAGRRFEFGIRTFF